VLVSGGDDYTMRWWDPVDGSPIRVLANQGGVRRLVARAPTYSPYASSASRRTRTPSTSAD